MIPFVGEEGEPLLFVVCFILREVLMEVVMIGPI